MSVDVNSISIIGRLTKDVELKYTQNGKAIANLSIANNYYNGKENAVNYFDVVVFGKYAETCNTYLKKGSQIAIGGSLRQERFTDKDGNNRATVKIIMNTMQMLGGKDNNNQQPQSQVDNGYNDEDNYPF